MEPLTIIAVSAVTTGLVEVVKRTRGFDFLKDRYEITALVIALGISTLGGLDILSGIIAGLTSQGIYNTVAKPTIKRFL